MDKLYMYSKNVEEWILSSEVLQCPVGFNANIRESEYYTGLFFPSWERSGSMSSITYQSMILLKTAESGGNLCEFSEPMQPS